MISVYDSIDKCCGCGACANVCTHRAISMDSDKYGFYYPVINQDKCIDCGLCRKICNYKSKPEIEPVETFVGQRVSDDILKSASGGIFAKLATDIIDQGGVVYGCIYSSENGTLEPIISEANTLSELESMFGSKYVQSSMNDIYIKVKKRLLEGRLVLFSGLPCQVAALKGFLRKEYENLYTIDIICHGAPNSLFFKSFISDLEEKIKGRIIRFNFRDKQKGWGDYIYSYSYLDKNGIERKSWGCFNKMVYYQLFLSASINRESCYHCPFASMNRPSDITIGDCWGIENEYSNLNIVNGGPLDFKKGLSCILVNTPKGNELINGALNELQLYPIPLEKIRKYNHQLSRPSYDSKHRKEYYNAFLKKGYKGLVKKYYLLEWKQILKSKIYSFLKNR